MKNEIEFQESSKLFECFYTTPRASADLLSDGGGPFGFDIHAALAIDSVIKDYGIKSIIETGTSRGDTAEYLARLYPELEITSIEIDKDLAHFAKLRLRKYHNIKVFQGNSAEILEKLPKNNNPTLYYLDAHGLSDWPLLKEIQSIHGESVIVIDDFDIGTPPFHYDTYNGVRCDINLIKKILEDKQALYSIDIGYKFKYPCLQMQRRGGKVFIPKNVTSKYISTNPMFKEVNHD